MKTIIIIAAFFITNISFAQYSNNVRSMSLGGIAVSNSYDIDAMNFNPANLILNAHSDNSKLHIAFFSSAAFSLNSNFLTYDFYNSYLTGDANGEKRHLNELDKTTIYNSAANTVSEFNAAYRMFSLVYNSKSAGSFGISLDERFYGIAYMPGDLLSLALFGNERNRTYNMSGTEMEISRTRQINITYANSADVLNGFSYGISVKPQFGYYYFGTSDDRLTLTTNDSSQVTSSGKLAFVSSRDENISAVMPGLTDFTGMGLALDIGFNLKFSKKFNIAASITDLGWMNWFKGTKKHVYGGDYFLDDISEDEQFNNFLNLMDGNSEETGEFSRDMPSYFKAGTTYRFFKGSGRNEEEAANVSFEYVLPFNRKQSSQISPVYALGIEAFCNTPLMVRAGLKYDENKNILFSAGLGITAGIVSIDLGTQNILSVANLKSAPSTSGGISIKLGL